MLHMSYTKSPSSKSLVAEVPDLVRVFVCASQVKLLKDMQEMQSRLAGEQAVISVIVKDVVDRVRRGPRRGL
jgi:hypothetical protein